MDEDDRRPRSVAEALSGLVERGVISAEQEREVRTALETVERGPRVRWAEVAGYLGGGLVLAAVGVFTTTWWDALSLLQQAALLGTVAIALLAAGVAMAGGPRALFGPADLAPTLRGRVASVLFALGALTTASAVFAPTDATFVSTERYVIGWAVGVLVAAVSYRLLPSAVTLVTAWAMSGLLLQSVLDLWSMGSGVQSLALAFALIALGVLWAGLAAGGVLPHRQTALGLGAAYLFLGPQTLYLGWSGHETLGYLLALGMAAVLLAGYVWLRSVALLVFGVISVTVAATEMVWELTDGRLSAPAILLFAGAVLLVSSWLGVRLRRVNGGGATTGNQTGDPSEDQAGDTPQ